MSHAARSIAASLATIGMAPAAPLWASEEAAEEHHAGHAEHHAPSVTELLFPAINFALFAVIIVKYVVPALREYLRRRAHDIAAVVAESHTSLTDAEASIATVRTRAGGAADEREAIRQDVVTSAMRQAERLRAQAEETGKRRLTDAALVAEQERRRALHEVRAEIAALATDLAETRLRAVLSPDDQRGFVREFLKEAPRR